MAQRSDHTPSLRTVCMIGKQSNSSPDYCSETLNNGHVGDECFVHCSDVVPGVEMYGRYIGGGK